MNKEVSGYCKAIGYACKTSPNASGTIHSGNSPRWE
jgi:L-2-hydroxyglutarate oxidase LhgO